MATKDVTLADTIAAELVATIHTYEWKHKKTPEHVLISMSNETYLSLRQSSNIWSYMTHGQPWRFMYATIAIDGQDVPVRYWVEAKRSVFS
jgi:hypothetical protein